MNRMRSDNIEDSVMIIAFVSVCLVVIISIFKPIPEQAPVTMPINEESKER